MEVAINIENGEQIKPAKDLVHMSRTLHVGPSMLSSLEPSVCTDITLLELIKTILQEPCMTDRPHLSYGS